MTMTLRGRTEPSPAGIEVPQWRRSWLPMVPAVLAAALLMPVAWIAFKDRSISVELAAVCGAVAFLSLGVWISGHGRQGNAVRLAVGAAVATVMASFWAWGGLAASITGVALAGAAAVGGAYRRHLARRAEPLEWLVVGLASATGDRREPTQILKPARGADLYPIQWYVPPTLAVHDDKTVEKIVDLIDTRLGGRHELQARENGRLLIVPFVEAVAVIEDDDRPSDVRRLDDVLAANLGAGARVRSWEFNAAGQLCAADLEWPASLSGRLSTPAMAARLTRMMTAVLAGDWIARWRLPEDRGRLELTERLPEFVAHPPRVDCLSTLVPFGRTLGGPATWDLDDAEPHLLIVGRTRGGKTSLARTLIAELGHKDVGAEIILVDPKRSGLRGLEYLPGVIGRWSPRDLPAMIGKIDWVYNEMNRRYDQLDDGKPRSEIKRLVLVIDEGRTLYELTKSHWNLVEKPELLREAREDESMVKPTGTEHPVIEKIRGILRLGGEAKINVIFITQQADADWLSTDARQNFGVRIALGNLDDEGLGMLYGKGARLPRLGTRADGTSIKGRAWVGIAGGTPKQVQVYWTPPPIAADLTPEDADILRALDLPIHDDEPGSDDLQASKPREVDEGEAAGQVDEVDEGEAAGQVDEVDEGEAAGQVDEVDEGEAAGQVDEVDEGEAAGQVDEVDEGEAAGQVEIVAPRHVAESDWIVVDHEGTRSVVEVIEVDDTDEELTGVSWQAQDGAMGVLWVDSDDGIERVPRRSAEA